MRDRSVFALVLLAACFPVAQAPPTVQPVAPGDAQLAARASVARSMGYPTRKTADDLAQMIAKQTKDFARAPQRADGRLEAPAPFVIEGVKGTCYTVVMRLGAGASWGDRRRRDCASTSGRRPGRARADRASPGRARSRRSVAPRRAGRSR